MEGKSIFEIHEGLPRQGPCSNKCTEKAFEVIPSLPQNAKILDVGCGSGMQTLHVAYLCKDCHITAVDVYQPYLDNLAAKASSQNCSERIVTVCASMEKLPFKENSFDAIWCEGAIFVMGFEKGLNYLHSFLKEGGYFALTEAAWFTDKPSQEALGFWMECYLDIKNIPECERITESAGYTIIGRFRLPASAWWDHYYIPLEKKLDSIEDKFRGNTDA